MDKDIFVDNNIAKNFCNPLDPEYKKFIIWLLTDGFLVVSNKILGEYNRTCSHSYSSTNIAIIVNKLLQEGRLKKYGNPELKKIVFKKSIVRRLRSNFKDQDHIRLVILSDRKYAPLPQKARTALF